MPDNIPQQQDNADTENSAADNASTGFTFQQDGSLVGPDGAKYVPLKRFSGLQAQYTSLKTTSEQTIANLNQQVTDLSGEAETLRLDTTAKATELETLQNQLSEKDTAISTFESQVAQLTAKQERAQIIASEFPRLVEYEYKGLLKEGLEGDDLKSYLSNFQEALSGSVTEQFQEQAAGSTPPSSRSTSSQDPTSQADIIDRLYELAGSRRAEDQKEYARLERLLDEIDG